MKVGCIDMALSLMSACEPMCFGCPDYKSMKQLGSEGTFVMDEDGFFQFAASSNATETEIFHRIKINDTVIDQGYTGKRNWTYYMSQLYAVRKGDTIITQGGTSGVTYFSYFFNERAN
jgi:hypothetical protein|nr:MAG TPA: collagen X [Caudoviricetes sp.]